MLETIYKRKSVRRYTGEKISDDQLAEIIRAGKAAAVGRGNYKNVLFTVINNRKYIDQMEEIEAEIYGKEVHPFFHAPQLILISVKPIAEEPDNTEFASVGCIAQNMQLAATELGVGSCMIWGAIRRTVTPEMCKELGIPEGYYPCGSVTLGKTNDDFEVNQNRHEIEVNVLD